MTPPPDHPPTIVADLRRQLLLAEVQRLEFEDARDEFHTRLASAQELLAQAQQVADRALRDCDRLAAEQAAGLASATLRNEIEAARQRESALAERVVALERALAERERAGAEAAASAVAARERVEQLAREREALKQSRSWRYTAPLRSLERLLRRQRPSA